MGVITSFLQHYLLERKNTLTQKKLIKKPVFTIPKREMRIQTSLYINVIIIAVAAFLFIPFIGTVPLFDWDEANFAESAREMLVSGDYFTVQINFQTFWEKPPLFIWLQAISMHIFGINEFAARFPNALFGIVTLVVIFNLGEREFDKRFGLLWVLAYAGSILPHFYFKSGIIDPVFNLFIFLGIYQFVKLTNTERYEKTFRIQKAVLAGVFIGLAVLTKGPVAFLIVALCICAYIGVKRSLKEISFKELTVYTLTVGLVSFGWFGVGLFIMAMSSVTYHINKYIALKFLPEFNS